MTPNRPIFSLLLLATACAPDIEAPGGQREVYPINYGVTELEDAAAVQCDNDAVSQIVEQYSRTIPLPAPAPLCARAAAAAGDPLTRRGEDHLRLLSP